MGPTATQVNEMLNLLEEQDYNTVIDFIGYLLKKRKAEQVKQNKLALQEIQEIFVDDKGWDSEEMMIEDMAAFRKERLGL